VAGYLSQIGKYKRSDLIEFHRRVYSAGNAVICYIGNLQLTRVSRTIEAKFRFKRRGRRRAASAPTGPGARSAHRYRPDWSHTHVCIGSRTVPASHPDRYALALLANILGGGVSSRLFQKMREERGLVYSVYSHAGFWRDTGLLVSAFSVDARNLRAAFEIFEREIDDMRSGNIREEELESAKAQLKASVIFGSESVSSRLFMLFQSHYHLDRYLSVSEIIDSIDRVDVASIAGVARRFLDAENLTAASCGPLTL
jgi:predicted Zn-dependent peptidase